MANLVGNNFWEGELGVVQLEFDTLDLGKTVDEATIEYKEDLKDTFFAQDGTQPANKFRTGAAWEVTVMLGQINIERLVKIIKGTSASGAGNSMKLGRELYLSGKDDEAKVLKVRRVDSEGDVTADLDYILNFYLAMPIITGNFAYGPDNQKQYEVLFYIFWNDDENAFGYSGYASSLGLANVA